MQDFEDHINKSREGKKTESVSLLRENDQIIRGRVYAAIIGLGGEAALQGFTKKQTETLRISGQGSTPATLRRSLTLDMGFAERTGMDLGPDLNLAVKKVLRQNMKGGDNYGS